MYVGESQGKDSESWFNQAPVWPGGKHLILLMLPKEHRLTTVEVLLQVQLLYHQLFAWYKGYSATLITVSGPYGLSASCLWMSMPRCVCIAYIGIQIF
jgi:hypothetical protein